METPRSQTLVAKPKTMVATVPKVRECTIDANSVELYDRHNVQFAQFECARIGALV